MSVVDINDKRYPPEKFEDYLSLFRSAFNLINRNLGFLWPYALVFHFIADVAIFPTKPSGVSAMLTSSTFIHAIFGATFFQLVITIFSTFLVVGRQIPCFASIKSYIYDIRYKLLTFAAVVCAYYFLYGITAFLVIPLFILPLFFFLIEPICIFEDRGFFGTFKRSAYLMNGAKFTTLLANCVFFITTGVVMGLVVNLPLYFIGAALGGGVLLSAIINTIIGLAGLYIGAVFSAYRVLFYLNRSKKVK